MSFSIKVGKCSQCDCGEERPIVNKTRNLCAEKNRIRLDAQTPDKKRREGSRFVKKNKGMKHFSKKRSGIEDDYRQAQKEIWMYREACCDECGRTDRLSFSHLIARSKRPDLIAEKKNIVLHCMSFDGDTGCHERWEAGDKTMKTFEKLTNIVKELSK